MMCLLSDSSIPARWGVSRIPRAARIRGAIGVFRRARKKFPSTFGSPGDTRPSAPRRVISRRVPIRRSIQCADEPFLTRFFPRLPQTQAYLCQQCDESIHKVNSIAGNHERRAAGPFTEEQLAGSGGSGSLGDDQFLELLESGAGGDAFVGLPDISEDGGLWDPNGDAQGGSFLADVKLEGAGDDKGQKNPKRRTSGGGGNSADDGQVPRQTGSQGSRGSGGSGGEGGERAGSSRGSGAVVGGRASVDGATGGGGSSHRGGTGAEGEFALNMDDYAQLDRMGNMDDLLGPILDDGALGGPGGFMGYEGAPGFHQVPHAMGGASGGATRGGTVGSNPGGIGRQFGQIAQSLSGERGGGAASGGSGGAASGGGGKGVEVKSEPANQGGGGAHQMPPHHYMHHPMAPGTHGMPPPPMMGGPGGGPGGPMPPGMQAMPPGTHGMPPPPGAMGGHGPPPGQPVQGPNGVMYFPGPPLPVLHLANGGSNKPPSRLERLRRWKEKRKNRNFNKTIRYQSRKVCADNRPRIKGKFVKVGSTPDLGALDLLGDDEGPAQAGPETLSDVEEDSFDSDQAPPPGALARTAGLRRDGGLTAAMSVPDLSRLG